MCVRVDSPFVKRYVVLYKYMRVFVSVCGLVV